MAIAALVDDVIQREEFDEGRREMKVLIICTIVPLLVACGNPIVWAIEGMATYPKTAAHTSSLNAEELRNVDDRTLCDAWHPRGSYMPSPQIILEMRRRGFDCDSISPPRYP
jgi:hypothetical protein